MENETEEHHEEEKSEVIFDLEETEDLGAITVSETDILQTDEDAEENDEVETHWCLTPLNRKPVCTFLVHPATGGKRMRQKQVF